MVDSKPPAQILDTSTKSTEDPTVPVNNNKSARVVLPKPPEDRNSDAEDEQEEEEVEEVEIDDSQILEDLPDETEDIDLTHSRIKSVSNLGLPRFAAHLKRLGLRQNFIKHLDAEVIGTLINLEELDLYDNKIKDVEDALNTLTNLSTLDLSFNLLRSVPDALHHLQKLKTVYFVQDRISTISGLDGLGATLTSIELGGNKIRKIEGLDALVNLQELWLGKNKITRLENLGNLKRLRLLSMQSNRVTKLENLDALENLEEIYLSHNGIEKLDGLEHNLKLRVIDIGNNLISQLENISHLPVLEELWANNNRIPTLRELESQLGQTKTLETIYLEGNPCQSTEGANYRRKIMLALPQVTQIDATFAKPL